MSWFRQNEKDEEWEKRPWEWMVRVEGGEEKVQGFTGEYYAVVNQAQDLSGGTKFRMKGKQEKKGEERVSGEKETGKERQISARKEENREKEEQMNGRKKKEGKE
ncbi:hypothetical protein scyTo_0020259 [Scyliorhinus torazame]|uniref:Uncharacterized protein n=1 Tax=Scyliorhinus torazame TaxID=75743 RepID=A0A401PNX6_SCYTO|nr:hypothetical protein [Scyliorhinus torazame]